MMKKPINLKRLHLDMKHYAGTLSKMKKTSDVYENVYHYTDLNGLLGILKTQSLWATNYKYLNDYSEIILFRDKLIAFLLPVVRERFDTYIAQNPKVKQELNKMGEISELIQHDTEVVVDSQYGATGDNIFITSFCGQHGDPQINENGLLSQWRGYGAGGGYAIVLNTKNLEETLMSETSKFQYHQMHLSNVIYSNDENKFKEELFEDLSIIANGVSHLFSNTEKSIKEEAVSKCYYPFVRCIGRFKHYGYKEENEVRIVAIPTTKDKEIPPNKLKKEIKYRNNNGQLIPYIELFDTPDLYLPIEKIIVGPHKEKEARAEALKKMLKNTSIEVTVSDIPYVC